MSNYDESKIMKNATSNVVQLNVPLNYGKHKGKTPQQLIEDGCIDYLFWLRSTKTNKNTGEVYKTEMSKELNMVLDWTLMNSNNAFLKRVYSKDIMHSFEEVQTWSEKESDKELNDELLEFEQEVERVENLDYGGW